MVALIAGLLAWAAPGPVAQAQVPHPFFCANRSLGGPQTYPFDSNGDNVYDTCSLRDTRRATVARQNALETLAGLFPDTFLDALHGALDDPDTPEDESTEGTCESAPTNVGDSEDDLAEDVCGLAARYLDPERTLSPPPPPVDPAIADVFFSGIITGPSFCANRSLGGPVTYPFDVNGDGIADICSLSTTKREAVARQNALEMFKDHPQFDNAVRSACAALGSTTFEGDSQAAMDKDACAPKSPGFTPGQALPTPVSS